MAESEDSLGLLRLTADLVAAYVRRNSLPAGELSGLIAKIHAALGELGQAAVEARPAPAVPISRSVTANFIVCLEDGKKFKMLRRHLKAAFGLTPGEYRRRWDLAPDYPMVAPNYAKQRSRLAKDLGLGRRRPRAAV